MEKRLDRIEKTLSKIVSNDLPHIAKCLTQNKTDISWLKVLAAGIFVAVIAGLVLGQVT